MTQQRLKPRLLWGIYGAAEAAPFQDELKLNRGRILFWLDSVCMEKCLSIKFFAQVLFAFVLAVFLSYPSAAQQTPPPANPTPSIAPQSSSNTDKDKDKNAQAATEQGKNAGTSN